MTREIVADQTIDDILSTAVDLVVVIDEEGTIQDLTDEGEPPIGYKPAEKTGESIRSLFASTIATVVGFDVECPEEFQTALLDGEDVTAPIETADGTVVTMSISTVQPADRSGMVCIAQETERPTLDTRQSGLVENIADPVYVLDSEGCFETVNEAMVEYTGYERQQLIGRSADALLPGGVYDRMTRGLLAVANDENRASETFETTLITKDGDRILTEAHVTVLTDEAGNYVGSVSVIRDIQERIHRERNLELLKQVLARVFRHNVRNQLMIAKTHASLLEEGSTASEQEHIDEILASVDRLLDHSQKARLIEQVIETERLYEIDITQTVEDVVGEIRNEYPAATINVDLPDDSVVDAHADIANAIRELVENGIKHAETASAKIDIWLDPSGDQQTLYVEDESGGVSDLERTVLEQGDEQELEHSSGVGLWLVRWLVEYSNAELIVHRTGDGTLVGIRFATTEDSTETLVGDFDGSSLAMPPADVQDRSPEQFEGDTVIGRVDPLQRLEESYEALPRSGGQSVLVTGEAGIGKTTLVKQFCEQLSQRQEGVRVAIGTCDSEGELPYAAFRQLLEQLPTEQAIRELFDDASELSVEDTDELQQRKRALFADIADELREVSTDQPVVLLLEDMQWADRSTVELFEYLVGEVGQWSHPVMFVGTYRTTDIEKSHPVLEIAEEIADAGRGTILELEPFSRDEVDALLSYMLDLDQLPSSFVEAVHDHTGGNPLFVNELGRHLVEQLGPVQSAAALPESLDNISLPDTVERTIADRLETIPNEVWPVLRLGAIIGQEFSFDVLREASSDPVDKLIECIETLDRLQVWTRSGERIEFVHGVIREQTLDTIGPEESDRLTARVADAIETVDADDGQAYAGRLATLYEQVGEYGTAFEYYRQAADDADEMYAHQRAIDQYERALSLATEYGAADDRNIAAVSVALGEIFLLIGEYDDASEHLERSLEISREIGDEAREAECLCQRGNLAYSRGNYDQSQTLYEESLELARKIGDEETEVKILNGLGRIPSRRGEHERAREYFEQSLVLCRETGNREDEARTLHNLGVIAWYCGEHDQSREYYKQALEIRREIGDRKGEAKTLNNLGVLEMIRCAYDQAREYYDQSREIKEQIGDRPTVIDTLLNLGNLAQFSGEYTQARDSYKRSLEIAREVGDRLREAYSLNDLGSIARRSGELDQAETYLSSGLEISGEIGAVGSEITSLVELGALSRQRGEYDRAREYLADSLNAGNESEHLEERGIAHLERARVALATEDTETAREAVTKALDIFTELGALHQKTRAKKQQGRVLAAEAEPEKALALWEEALDTFEEIGAPQDSLETLEYLVETARQRGEDERQKAWYEQAKLIFQDAPAPIQQKHRDWIETTADI